MARPREFDMDVALTNAMSAFWDHGYEATSVSDLMEAMDLQKGSIYKAFGDKHNLFITALEHYLVQAHVADCEKLEGSKSPKQVIKDWLMSDVMPCCKQSFKRGCLMINAISELAYKDEQVEKIIKDHLAKLTKLLTTVVLEGQQLKEFRTDSSAKELANLIVVNLIGMITLTKCNTSQSVNQQNIKNLMALLEK